MTEIQPQEGREWWPSEYMDESMPAGRATPTAWLYRLDDGAHRVGEVEDDAWPTWPIAEGETFTFSYCDTLGTYVMTVQDDGSATWDRMPPADAYLYIDDDVEMGGDGPEDFERNLRSFNILEPGETYEIGACRWTDGLVFRFTAIDGPPRFLPAPSASQ